MAIESRTGITETPVRSSRRTLCRMGVALAFGAAVLAAGAATAATPKPVYKHWATSYPLPDPASHDWILAVAPTSQGGYLAAGFVGRADDGDQNIAALMKVDAHGDVLWWQTYELPQDHCNGGRLSDVIEVSDGYVAVGEVRVPFDSEFCNTRALLVKTRFDGSLVFSWQHDDPGRAGAVRALPDGRLLVVGHVKNGDTKGQDFLVTLLDAKGKEIANQPIGLAGDDRASDLTLVYENPILKTNLIGVAIVGSGGKKSGESGDMLIAMLDETLFETNNPKVTVSWFLRIDSLTEAYEVTGTVPGSGTFMLKSTPDLTTGPCPPPPSPTGKDVAQSVEQTRSGQLLIGGKFNSFDSGPCGDICVNPDTEEPCGYLCVIDPDTGLHCGTKYPFFLDADGIVIEVNLDLNLGPTQGDFDKLSSVRHVAHCSGLDFHVVAHQLPPPLDTRYALSCTTADKALLQDGEVARALLVEVEAGNQVGKETYHTFKAQGTGLCAFDMAVTGDGGFIVGGNNGASRDDWVLAKLYSPCQRDAKFNNNDDIDGDYVVAGNQSETWSSSRKVRGTVRVDGRLVIDQGAVIEFADTRQLNDFDDDVKDRSTLVVEPGGTVIIRGGATLRGLDECNGMWEGVQVLGDPSKSQVPASNQGLLILRNGATIQDAVVGVEVGKTRYNKDGHRATDWGFGGGIVRAVRAVFRNNRKSVGFQPYDFPSRSFFESSTFVCSDLLPDPDYVDLEGRRLGTSQHLSLFDVRGVRINRSTFEATGVCAALDADLRGTGIATFNASFTVGNQSRFHNLSRGIVSESSRNDRRLSVSNSIFDGVGEGISSRRQRGDIVRTSRFRLPFGGPGPGPAYAIRFDGSSRFRVAGNQIRSTLLGDNRGIVVVDSKGGNSKVSDNAFKSVAVGVEAAGANPQLQIFCNRFDTIPAGAIYLAPGASLADQGAACAKPDPGQGADNAFNAAPLISLGDKFKYYHPEELKPQPPGFGPLEILSCPTPRRCPRRSGPLVTQERQ